LQIGKPEIVMGMKLQSSCIDSIEIQLELECFIGSNAVDIWGMGICIETGVNAAVMVCGNLQSIATVQV
jgi:hypothetical protein